MKRLAIAFSFLALACKKPAPAKGTATSDGGPVGVGDGGSGGGEPDEADVRAGKRTGLEAPDSKPEVATEPLARGFIRGTTPWSKVVDNSLGVVEMADGKVTHRCGTELDHALAAFAASAAQSLDAPGLVYDVVCDNAGLSVTIAGVTSHAVCSISSPSGDGLEHDMVFVPDPKLGLRLIGLSTTDALTTEDALRDQFDEHLGRFGTRCP